MVTSGRELDLGIIDGQGKETPDMTTALVDFWRMRAEQVRELTTELHAPESKATILKIADEYEKLAARAAKFTDSMRNGPVRV
jgi:hypothetical protein